MKNKTTNETDSLPMAIVYAPMRGRCQYVARADGNWLSRKRDEAHAFRLTEAEALVRRLQNPAYFVTFRDW